MPVLDPAAWDAIALSLRVALVATLFSLPLAVWVAQLLSRGGFRGWHLLNIVVHLPLVLPPVVTGYLLLLTFGRQGWIGATLFDLTGYTLAFRWTGAALAAAVMAFPLMVRAIRLSFDNIDPGLKEAARTLGAGRTRIFRQVTLPLIWPGVLAGGVLGFAKALGEFGATITFVAAIPGETRTIPSAIYALLQVPGQEDAIVGLVLIAVLLSIGALVLSEWLAARARRKVRQDA